MTTEANPAAGASAPAAPSTAVPATPPAPAAPVPNVGDPDWLNGRIAQAKSSERAAILAELGVTDPEEAKKAIAVAKAAAEASKSAETRAAELKAQFDGLSAKTAEQLKIIAEHAGRQMVGLTAEQKAAVTAVAGDDPGAQLRAIAALQPTWTAPAAPVIPAAPPPPANTAPGHTAPAAAAAGSPPNNRAAYEAAQKTNPFAAADFGLRHSDDVYKPRP